MPKVSNKIDYSKMPISFYMFVCDDETVTDSYVGHTGNFRQRKCVHKNKCNNPNGALYNSKIYRTIRENGGWDCWNMVEIKCQLCLSSRDAARIEQELITKLKSTMNSARAYIDPSMRKEVHNIRNANYRASHKADAALYRASHKAEAAAYRASHKAQAAAYRAKYRQQKAAALLTTSPEQ